MVALVVLATAAVAAAGLFSVSAQSTRVARFQTWATFLAVDKLEQLRALAWTVDDTGTAVSDTSSDVSADAATSGGRGLSSSPQDSLDRDTPGWVDYLDAAGRWVGNGAAAPAEAVYARRWNVQRLPGDPDHTLVLRVLVTQAGRPGTSGGRIGGFWTPGAASIAAVRTRKGQR